MFKDMVRSSLSLTGSKAFLSLEQTRFMPEKPLSTEAVEVEMVFFYFDKFQEVWTRLGFDGYAKLMVFHDSSLSAGWYSLQHN